MGGGGTVGWDLWSGVSRCNVSGIGVGAPFNAGVKPNCHAATLSISCRTGLLRRASLLSLSVGDAKLTESETLRARQ